MVKHASIPRQTAAAQHYAVAMQDRALAADFQ